MKTEVKYGFRLIATSHNRFNDAHLLLFKALENLYKKISNDLYDLMIIMQEGHLKIKADKLRHMTMRVRVFSTKHCTNNKTSQPLQSKFFHKNTDSCRLVTCRCRRGNVLRCTMYTGMHIIRDNPEKLNS